MAAKPDPLVADSLWNWTKVTTSPEAVPVREVRLGITMVGGSSLAIYENGVAQELFRLAHGRGGYGLLKKLTHSHILLDIFSGTSAGGINTILLSSALAAGKEVFSTRDLWIAAGGIGDLMQDPLDKKVESVLRGDGYYYDSLMHGFQSVYRDDVTVGQDDVPSPPEKDGGPGAQELDLFVTGTFYEGRPYTFFDARNRPLAGKDHKGVFHLKHRPNRHESHFVEDLEEPETGAPAPRGEEWIVQRLARIARTTSSLPAMFEPSPVDPEAMGKVIALPRQEGPSYMVDGGYLNNKPINLTLKAIYERAANREVVRKFFFVDPVPEERTRLPEDTTWPNALENLLFYFSVPAYQGLVSDLQQMEEHNRRVRSVRSMMEKVQAELTQGPLRDAPGPRQHNTWVSLRLDRLSAQLIDAWAQQRNVTGEGANIVSGSDHELAAARQKQRDDADALRAIELRLSERLRAACLDWHSGMNDNDNGDGNDGIATATADVDAPQWRRRAQTQEFMQNEDFYLDQVDTDFVMRKVYRLIYDLYDALYPSSLQNLDPCLAPLTPGAKSQTMQDVLSATLHQRREVCEQLRRTLSGGTRSGDTDRVDTPFNGDTLPGNVDQWQRLNLLVEEWYRLRDVLEMLGMALGSVCARIADSTTYASAAQAYLRCRNGEGSAQEFEEAVQQLWVYVRSIAQELLALPSPEDDRLSSGTPSPGALLPKLQQAVRGWRRGDEVPDEGVAYGAVAEPERITAEEVSAFRRYLTARTAQVCEQIGQGETFRSDSAQTVMTYVDAVSSLLDQQVQWAAQALQNQRVQSSKQPMDGKENNWPLAWAADISRTKIRQRSKRLDAYLFPVEVTAGLQSRDEIELVRISPGDWQDGYSARLAKLKIAGDEALNFGGFFKRSWRANDILWGRLDAADALVSTLLERPRLIELIVSHKEQGGTAEDLLDGLSAFFGPVPPSPERSRSVRLADFLHQRYQRESECILAWMDDPLDFSPQHTVGFTKLRDLLISYVQLDILMDEVPQALAEDESERSEWTAHQEDDSVPSLMMQSTPAKDTKRHPLLKQFTVGRLTQTARFRERMQAKERAISLFSDDIPPSARPESIAPQRVHEFFSGYRIGEEQILRDIPPQVLLRQGLGAILIVVHILENLLNHSQFRKSGVGSALATWILKPIGLLTSALYHFFTLVTHGPRVVLALQSALIAVAIGLGIAGLARIFGGEGIPAWGWYLPVSLLLFALLGFYAALRRSFGWAIATMLGVTITIALGLELARLSGDLPLSAWAWWWPCALMLVTTAALVEACRRRRMAAVKWMVGLGIFVFLCLLLLDINRYPNNETGGVNVLYVPSQYGVGIRYKPEGEVHLLYLKPPSKPKAPAPVAQG